MWTDTLFRKNFPEREKVGKSGKFSWIFPFQEKIHPISGKYFPNQEKYFPKVGKLNHILGKFFLYFPEFSRFIFLFGKNFPAMWTRIWPAIPGKSRKIQENMGFFFLFRKIIFYCVCFFALVLACDMSYWAKHPFSVVDSSHEPYGNN